MDVKEYKRVVISQVEEHLLKKIDRVIDTASDSHRNLHEDEIREIKDCFKALWYAKQYCKEP
jgi:hypothetical protein